MSRPVVAIAAYALDAGRVEGWRAGAYAIPDAYVDAVVRAGGAPILLVSELDGRERPFDALVLAGGGDVDPGEYGVARHPSVAWTDLRRDRLEIALTRSALGDGVPILAICRGMQVVNVALGGTLHQHLPEWSEMDHGRDGDIGHPVELEPRSRLSKVTGNPVARCISHHHQGIDRLGTGLVPVGWSADGLVEAVESSAGDLLGVQWHPERSAFEDPVQQALFDDLVIRADDSRVRALT